ncbi:hypothetical protein XENOCAPTIV_008222 [Xenoophorus captivus]|uniref:NR LBD domain-containing protein n=1 Tax=Xenoophorus captivus TaxID=1517983 RepID=A0ABV0RPG6_9TELE
MSKRQRDSLIAEVERHRQQQQQQQLQGDTQVTLSYPTKNRQDRSPQLLQPMATAYSYSGDAELLPYGAEVHPYLCSPSDSQLSGMIYRDSPTSRSQGRGDNSGHHDVRDELCASIVRSHRETSQYRLEELQALRWKVFSREEIQAYQSKTVDEMWQHCAVRLTDAVQYVVEFAKHVPGFRMLSQNDQIALLKTDRPSLEDRGRVQRVQRSVEMGLTHILHRDNQDSLMHKLHQRMAVLRSLCSLHMEKLRWFSQRYPLIAHSLFPPLYKELFASEAELLPGATH